MHGMHAIINKNNWVEAGDIIFLTSMCASLPCRSKYKEEEIGLMPEEEFLATAPEQFKEGIEDPHKRMLQVCQNLLLKPHISVHARFSPSARY